MLRLLHAAVAATLVCVLCAVGATLFAAPAEAQSARGTDGILYQPYRNNRVVFEGTGEVDNVYTSNRGTDIDPDTPGIQVRGIMYFATGCFAPKRSGTLTVTARIVSGDRGAVGILVRNNQILQCVYAWAKTDLDRNDDSVRVTATAVLTNDGTEVDRFEDTFTVEQRDTRSGVGESVGGGAPLDLTAPPPRTFTAGRAINVPALPAASGGSGSYSYALTGRGGAARPSWIRFDPAMRRMTGTPPASAAGTTATLDYTVSDGRTSQTQRFTVTVNAAPSLTAPSDRTYTAGTAISAFTLQAASGGTTPLVYEVEDLPAGLEFKPATRELSGTPSTATTDPVAVTYKVTDANGVEATDTFSVTVFPALELDAPADLSLKQGQALADTILPAATGGDGSYSYAIFPAPPEGLAFDSGTRVLSGTPESAQATTEYRYVVGDGIDNFAETTFAITVVETAAPTVLSVERHNGTAAQAVVTRTDTLRFRVTFSEDVENVTAADFSASGTSGAGARRVAPVTGDKAQYIVTVGGGTLASHDGEVGLTFASGQNIADEAGNTLTATTPTGTDETYTVDNTRPTVTLARADGAATTLTGAFDVTVTFTEANGLQTSGPGAFTASDLAVTNGDATSVTVPSNPLVWTARITPHTGVTGTVHVGLPANRVLDVAGNSNRRGATLIAPLDSSAPTVTSIERHDGTNAQYERTNADTLKFRVTFSEDVKNVTAADFDASGTNGDATGVDAVAGDDAQYIVTVTGGDLDDYEGTVGLTLASGQDITDSNGNPLDATLPAGTIHEAYTLDNTAPKLVSVERHDNTNALDELTNADTLKFRVTFSELVMPLLLLGMSAEDFDATGVTGEAITITAISVTQFVINVSGGTLAEHQSKVGLIVKASPDIEDAAGNVLDTALPTGTSYETYTADRTAPRPALGASSATHDGSSTTVLTIDFGEPVTGFTVDDIAATNATKSSFTGSDGDARYTVTLTPTAEENIVASIAGSRAMDRAGNLNNASASLTVTHDPVNPSLKSITRSNPRNEITNASSVVFSVTFSEAVQSVDGADFKLVNGDGDDLQRSGIRAEAEGTGGTTYAVTVRLNLSNYDGRLVLRMDADDNDITDLQGNALSSSATPTDTDESFLLDILGPAVALARADGSNDTLGAPFDVTVTFTEANGLTTSGADAFAMNDIGVTNGSVTSLTGGPLVWTATVAPAADFEGDVTVAIAADVVTDAAGNGNSQAVDLEVPVDTDAPTVLSVERHDGTGAQGKHTNADTLVFRVTFSEDVENVNGMDFDASGTSGSDVSLVTAVPGNAAQYIVTVGGGTKGGTLASHDGEVGLTFASGQNITDAAGNAFDASLLTGTNYETYTVDNTAPKPALSASPATHDGSSTSVVTIDFGDAVTGFVVGDIGVNGGTKSGFNGDDGDSTYTVTVTPGGFTDVLVSIEAGVATDAAGNANLSADDLAVLDSASFSWTATLTVSGSESFGYCSVSCNDGSGFGVSGSLVDDGGDNAFDIPATSDSVAVTMLVYDIGTTLPGGGPPSADLHLRLTPLPPKSVYSAWTLNVGGREASLSGTVLVQDNGSVLRFNDFYQNANNAPGVGATAAVCIRAGSGGCSGASGASGATAARAAAEAPEAGLAARFGALPEWHAGMAFWMELHFSEAPHLGYKDVRDKLLDVTGGRLLSAQRLEQGSNQSWRIEVLPAGFDDITLTLPATEDCAAEGAVCTADGERMEAPLSVTVPGPGDRLAARLTGFSTRHDGEPFEPELWFNHAPNLGYRDVRDTLFEVTGGRITRARRQQQGSNLRWNLVVEPEAVGDLTLTVPATEDCAAPRAVCTQDGRKLARELSVTIEGPAAFSVSDAQVDEGPEAVLAFEVSLSRRLRAEARVDVATRDGTATAGADYEAVTQTLVFARGETVKTVEVAVLDDAHDEGEETMTLVLSNAEGAPVADAEGTGTIVNSDAIPKAWIARFGRTVTGQVLDAVEGRLAAPRQAGMRVTLAGRALASRDGGAGAMNPGAGTGTGDNGAGGSAPAGTDRAALATLGDWMAHADGLGSGDRFGAESGLGPHTRTVSGRELLHGTSFALTTGSAEGGGHGSLWGHASVAGFDGREDALSLDGEVTTGFLGADWAAERWTAGLALGHSAGTGGYRNGECAGSAPGRGCGGRIEAELTGLYPYAGVDLNERVSVWLAGGHGAGALTVVPDGQGAIETDLAMSMGAAGTRIAVLEPEGGEGFSLALEGDGRFTRTSSDAASAPDGGNLAEAETDVWLLRFGVEGSRPFALGGSGAGDDTGASLTPSFEVGVRRDGGDAETGFGADMGGGVAFTAPQRGLRFDLKGRALVAHDAPGFREWGASAAFGFDPRPATERGLALSLTQSWGASPSGGMDALLGGEALSGPVANDDAGTGFTAPSRLSGELGYGLPAFGGGFTGTPNLGFGLSSDGARDWRLGWRLTSALRGGPRFEVSLDATRREGAGEPAEHGAMLTGRFRW